MRMKVSERLLARIASLFEIREVCFGHWQAGTILSVIYVGYFRRRTLLSSYSKCVKRDLSPDIAPVLFSNAAIVGQRRGMHAYQLPFKIPGRVAHTNPFSEETL
jgi:hypothetical protein